MARNQSGYGQDATRRQGVLYDNHDRKYSASIDKKSGFPVGVIQPDGWTAPWYASQTFFKFEDEDSPNRFRIDYQTMLDERIKAHEAYAFEYRKAALDRGWDPEDQSKAAAIIQVVGPKPLPIEPIVAAMQGNRWILGFTKVVDKRLQPFVRQRTDRVTKAIAGMDFSDDEPLTGTNVVETEKFGDDFDDLLDLEEAVDPAATGGKRVNPKKTSKAA
jgi:hypothetical protein